MCTSGPSGLTVGEGDSEAVAFGVISGLVERSDEKFDRSVNALLGLVRAINLAADRSIS